MDVVLGGLAYQSTAEFPLLPQHRAGTQQFAVMGAEKKEPRVCV